MCHIVSLIFDGDCRAAELRKGWSSRQPEAVVRVYSYLLQVGGREAGAASLQHWKQEARLGRIWSTTGGERRSGPGRGETAILTRWVFGGVGVERE